MKKIFLILIRAYQILISPFLGSHCRFYPSCSSYSHKAFDEHGTGKALFLSIKRVARCHPFSSGGYDPVPNRKA